MRGTGFNKLLFNVGSAAYDVLTGHDAWYEQASDLVEFIRSPNDVRDILDLGCGPGASAFALARLFPDSNVEGLDLARRMIGRARQHHAESFAHLSNLRFHCGNAEDLAWPDEAFDLVVGHSFLYLVPDRAAVLRQARRVLRPGGTLLLLEPNAQGSFRDALARDFGRDFSTHSKATVTRFRAAMVAWRVVSGNVGRIEPDAVANLLADTGFEQIEIADTLGGLGMHCVARVR